MNDARENFIQSINLLAPPTSSTIDAWMIWANNIVDLCQEQESTHGTIPLFSRSTFDAGKNFIIGSACTTAYVERAIIFCALLALCHTQEIPTPTEKEKIPLAAYFSKQRQFFTEWVTETNGDENEQALLEEFGAISRTIAPDNLWDAVQYLANVPSMRSIHKRIDVSMPLDRSSLTALLHSIKRRKTAAIIEKNEIHIYCGIDTRTLRWQANWWIDFWKMRVFDEELVKDAQLYAPPPSCTYTNHWILASLREVEWMKETLVYLQDYFFNDIALPGMAERGFQRTGFRNHSGNVLWSEFETLACNALRDTINRDALDVHNALCIKENNKDEVEFHWEMLRGIYIIVTRLVAMRFTKMKTDDRFFMYNMLVPTQKSLVSKYPLLVGIRQHFVLINGKDRTLYKRPHLLHAVADWMLLSFPQNARIRFLMTEFRDNKMISPHDAISVHSAKIVSNDNSQRGFFRE